MKNIICTLCPKGCHLSVDLENMTVSGNNCPRGVKYGISELTAPMRTLTSTVKIDGAICRRCPVRSSADVPRESVAEIMKLLDTVQLTAPVSLGDVIFENVLGTGADIIVTRNLKAI
ncbi:MAG: DUF1667 domain-containing protein [Clostridia bacterium]|nr:DUF1667 domain-containing protein [Clostridia bacterium]